MMIKVILIALTVSFGLFVLRDAGTGRALALRRLGGVAFVLAAVAAVLFPDALTWMANQVGVRRGSDLLLYGLVVAYLFTTAASHQRIHHLEERITRLARAQALSSAGDHDLGPAAEAPAGRS
jgi:hypothetical protein